MSSYRTLNRSWGKTFQNFKKKYIYIYIYIFIVWDRLEQRFQDNFRSYYEALAVFVCSAA